MLDSEGFVKAGWVHDLQLYQFKGDSDEKKFFVMAKVLCIKHH